jgi:hypothetical protein
MVDGPDEVPLVPENVAGSDEGGSSVGERARHVHEDDAERGI